MLVLYLGGLCEPVLGLLRVGRHATPLLVKDGESVGAVRVILHGALRIEHRNVMMW